MGFVFFADVIEAGAQTVTKAVDSVEGFFKLETVVLFLSVFLAAFIAGGLVGFVLKKT